MTTGHITEAILTTGKGIELNGFRFQYDTANDPTNFTGALQLIESVSHDSTGVHTVTVREQFRRWLTLAVVAGAELETTLDANIVISGVDPVAGTFEVNTYVAGSLADVAAGAITGNFATVMFISKFSSAIDGTGY